MENHKPYLEGFIFLILLQPEIQEGMDYGKPRKGHPEGKVFYHTLEIIEKINGLGDTTETIFKLYILAIIHDSLKFKVDCQKPKIGENDHGMIARRFAEKFISDETFLSIIELHDRFYYLWRRFSRNGIFEQEEFKQTMNRVKDEMNIFLKFVLIDGATGDKSSEPRRWFLNKLVEMGYIHFSCGKETNQHSIESLLDFYLYNPQHFNNCLCRALYIFPIDRFLYYATIKCYFTYISQKIYFFMFS